MEAYQEQKNKPFLLGTSLELSQTDHPIWQPQPHDHPLQALLTESSLYLMPQ
jgi:5-formyltetrahydrofolate cyclo-ligase